MNRKKFILNSSFFLIGVNFLQASTLVSSSKFQIQTKNPINISLLLKKAADLRNKNLDRKQNKGLMSRRNFFSSPTNNSNTIYSIYDQVLQYTPSEIRAYNGMRKLMIQEDIAPLAILDMYVEGMKVNKTNPLFLDRTAKEYMRILSGNTKQIQNLPSPYNQKEDVLAIVENYLEQAILLDSSNQQFSTQLNKTQQLKTIGFFSIDARDNVELKAQKKQRKLELRTAELALTSSELLNRINRLKSRSLSSDLRIQICKLEKRYIKRLQQEKKYSLAVNQCLQYFNDNPDDVDGLKLVRITLLKNKRYDLLEDIERENNRRNNTFWSHIALINILFKRIELQNKSNFPEVSSLIIKAKQLAEFNNQQFEIKYRIAKLNILSNASLTENSLVDFGKEIERIRNPYRIDRYTRLCVDYFQSKNQSLNALKAIDIVLFNNFDLVEDNKILQQLQLIGFYRKTKTIKDNYELEKLKEKILNA